MRRAFSVLRTTVTSPMSTGSNLELSRGIDGYYLSVLEIGKMFLQSDHGNFPVLKRTCDTLRANVDRLVEMTTKYPVICEFAGFREIFRSRSDVEGLIERLIVELADHVKHVVPIA